MSIMSLSFLPMSKLFFLLTLSALPFFFAMIKGQAEDSEEDDGNDDSDKDGGDPLADMEISLRDLYRGEKELQEELIARIEANEKLRNSGTKGLEKTLAQDYLSCALDLQEEDIEKSMQYLERGIKVLTEALEEEPSEELTRMLGMARLSFGVMLNDEGLWSEALEEYALAEKVMSQLAGQGDLEAKLDLAGIRLNEATIYFELGECEEALDALQRVKGEFSTLMGTPRENEALFYLAKTALQMASIYEEEGETDEAVRQTEEAIRLYRKMIENGDDAYRYDLGLALASYARLQECSGEKTPEELLAWVDEAISYFHESIAVGRTDVCPDLFSSSLVKGRLLNHLNRHQEAEEFLTELLEIFDQLRATDDPSALLNLMTLHDERGKARLLQKRPEEALEDDNEGIEIGHRLLDEILAAGHAHHHCGCGCHDGEDEECHCGDDGECHCYENDDDDEEDECGCGCHDHESSLSLFRYEVRMALFSLYLNRAKSLAVLRRLDDAKKDVQKADQYLSGLEEYLGEDFEDYQNLSQALAQALQKGE